MQLCSSSLAVKQYITLVMPKRSMYPEEVEPCDKQLQGLNCMLQ